MAEKSALLLQCRELIEEGKKKGTSLSLVWYMRDFACPHWVGAFVWLFERAPCILCSSFGHMVCSNVVCPANSLYTQASNAYSRMHLPYVALDQYVLGTFFFVLAGALASYSLLRACLISIRLLRPAVSIPPAPPNLPSTMNGKCPLFLPLLVVLCL
mgnify:CR=1 FL=1